MCEMKSRPVPVSNVCFCPHLVGSSPWCLRRSGAVGTECLDPVKSPRVMSLGRQHFLVSWVAMCQLFCLRNCFDS